MKPSVCVVSNKERREEIVYCFARREFVEDLTCVEEFRSVQSERYSIPCVPYGRGRVLLAKNLKPDLAAFGNYPE